jgi:hypothetical protein
LGVIHRGLPCSGLGSGLASSIGSVGASPSGSSCAGSSDARRL